VCWAKRCGGIPHGYDYAAVGPGLSIMKFGGRSRYCRFSVRSNPG
jgi:hypothetical protein